MICQTIFSNGTREWTVFGQDPNRPMNLIDTNQILITEGLQGILVDPGSLEVFPKFLDALSKKFAVGGIIRIFFSNQDPDVVSSLPLWQRVVKHKLSISVSEIYAGSLSHLDAQIQISAIPDAGAEIPFGNSQALRAIPAHYLHSPGNFHLYDPTAKALFTGKVGTASTPFGPHNGFIVEHFIPHIEYMLSFHQRWMPSKEARDAWLRQIADIEIDTLVPQRGLIFKGDDVGRFFDWFSELRLATAIQSIYPEETFADRNNYEAPRGEPEPGAKYRLVTRSDFDGIVCSALLNQLHMISDIIFVNPNDMQQGRVNISENDIIANLPYVPGCFLAFDHHSSEVSRLGKKHQNLIIDPSAPSAARVIYEYYGGKLRFPNISDELMNAVDKADSGQLTISEVLNAEGWPLLNFIMDPRTGFSRFRGFRLPNYEFMMSLTASVQEYSVDQILELPEVKERAELYLKHEKMFKEQIERCAEIHENLVFVNYLKEENIYVGNRFMVYAIFPQCNISIHQMWGRNKQKIVFSCGKSIFDRSSKTDVGELMLKFGGGGHIAAGTCQVEPSVADTVRQELMKKINSDG